MRKLLFFLFLFIFPVQAFCATYYVRSTGGDNGNAGTSYAQAWAGLDYAISQLTAGDTLKVDGTFAETTLTDADGTAEAWITVEAYDTSNPPTINGTGTRTILQRHQYWKFRYLNITSATNEGIYVNDDDVLIEYCDVYHCATRGVYINAAGADNVVVRYNKIRDQRYRHIEIDAATQVDMYYNLIYGSWYRSANDYHILLEGAGTYNIYNNTILSALNYPIRQIGAGITTNFKNNIIAYYGISNDGPPAILVTSGTFNYDYNLITGNSMDQTVTVTGGNDGGHNLIGRTYFPEFTKLRDKGYFLLTVDDFLDAIEDIHGVASTYDLPVTWFVNQANVIPEENYQSRMQALYATGDIAFENHCMNHVKLEETHHGTLTYDGADSNPTIDIDHDANTITLTTDEQNDDVTITDTDEKDMGDFADAVSGTNWSYVKSTWQVTAEPISSIADTDGADALTGTPPDIDLMWDLNQYYDNEIGGGRDWVNSMVGYTPQTMSYPWWNFNDDVITGAIDNGMLAARSQVDSDGYALTEIGLYELGICLEGAIAGDDTEAVLRYNIRQLVRSMANAPSAVTVISHGWGFLSEEQYGWMCDELSNATDYVEVITYPEFADIIRNSGDWEDKAGDQRYWWRDYADSGDYTLQSSSPCIDAGTDLSFTQDYAGNPIVGDPDIGAYEYQPVKGQDQEIMMYKNFFFNR
jgi:hypothetical protein